MRGTMTARTAGAYLQRLREEKRISRAKAAAALGTSESQIERIDYGSSRVNGELLLGYIRYLGANLRHVMHLMLDDVVTQDDDTETMFARIDALSPERKRMLAAIIRDLLRAEGLD